MMSLRSLLLVAGAAAAVFAQVAPQAVPPKATPYLAAQPEVQLPQRPQKPPMASADEKLAQEERDARFLMDLQIANQTRAAQSSETVRANQEKASAALLEYYSRLLEPQGGVGAQGAAAGSGMPMAGMAVPTQSAPVGSPAARVNAAAGSMEAAFAEDGPTIARKRGLGYLAKGSIIDIRLYTAVNTSIPGVVVGEVAYDVWDVSMRYILIPRGSKVTGSSSQMGTDTESGGKVVFDTFIDPTGREVAIAVPVVTSSRIGITGMPGKVDYHWGRVFGGSVALAVINAFTGQGNAPAGNNASMTQEDMMRQNLMQQTGQMSNSLLQRFTQVKPDITLKEGDSAKIILLQHMMVKPFQRVY